MKKCIYCFRLSLVSDKDILRIHADDCEEDREAFLLRLNGKAVGRVEKPVKAWWIEKEDV